MDIDDNYMSFFYDKIEDFLIYITAFFYKENKLYIENLYDDKCTINNKIDDIEIDNLINEIQNDIKFDKEYLELENRYNILVEDIKEIEENKKTDEEDDENDNQNNKPNNGELIAILL